MRTARLLPLLAGLALAGCGGGTVTTSMTTTAPLVPLPSATADQLAAEADAIAADLDRGDGCAAQADVARLRADTVAAINAHLVPGPYQETLLGRVQALEAGITCIPPAPADNGQGNGKKKHGHGKGDG